MIIDNSRALILFLKPPVKGAVKTRLASDIGDEKAFEIYQKLLHHTLHTANCVNAYRYIFLSNEEPLDIDLPPKSFEIHVQQGSDLGEKMSNAFEFVFEKGVTDAVIIGSDNIQITPAHLEYAFNDLLGNDVVIGPSNDGGYYLLGMIEHYPDLFEDINWSTESVYKQTIERAKEKDLKVKSLEELADIDHWSDVESANWQNIINQYRSKR